MPISIHLPPEVLRRVDQRARRLGVSRSRYIADALRREDDEDGGWSPGFFEELRHVDEVARKDVDELIRGMRPRRSRKAAPRL